MAEYFPIDVSSFGSYSGSFSGSFFGNGSGITGISASNAISASYAATASYLLGSIASASYALSASYAANGGVTQLLAGPNITLSPTNGLGQVTVSATLSGSTIFNTSTGSYGSFYDTTTQTNPVANVPRSMSFNSTDITNGVSISGSTNPFNTYVKVINAGIYNIQFSAQVDKTDGGTDDIVIWLRKNGIDLTDTATTLTLPTNNSKVVAAWNWFVTSAAGDYYQIIWVSADTDLRLLAEPISGTHPGIPSVILTVNRVDQFLSNTGSFSGSFNGSFTGSLFGTASWATNALTASFINTASTNAFVQNGNSFGATALLGTNDNQSLAFETSGSVRMFISSSGNVGIGTTTDSRFKLTVFGGLLLTGSTLNAPLVLSDGNYIYGGGNTASANAIFGAISTQTELYARNDRIGIWSGTGGGNYLYSVGGNFGIGIGANTPSARLQVRGSGATSATTALRVENSSASPSLVVLDNGYVGIGTGSAAYKLDVLDNAGTYVAQFRGSNSSYVVSGDTSLAGESGFNSRNSSGQMFLGVSASIVNLSATTGANTIVFNTGGAERMRIGSSGNVSIGTTGSSYNLNVANTIAAGVASSTNGTIRIERSGGGTGLIILGSTGSFIGAGGSPVYEPYNYADASHNFNIGHASAGNYNWFVGTNATLNLNTQLMRLTRGGNLLIGTTTDSARLTVRGSGATNATTALRVENTNTSASLVVLDNGNVGVGTTTPSGRLDVSANLGTQTAGDLVVDTANNIVYIGKLDSASGNTNLIFRNRLGGVKSKWANAGAGSIWFGDFVSGYGVGIQQSGITTETTLPGSAIFHVDKGTLGGTVASFIKGNVGIGTINPSASLHISGSSNSALLEIDSPAVNNILYVSGSGNVGIGTSTPAYNLEVVGSNTNTARFFGGGGTAVVGIGVNGTLQSSGGQFRLHGNASVPLSLGSHGVWGDLWIINGNVGIGQGTTAPTLSSRFTIKGSGATSATTALRVENTNASASLVVLDNGSVIFGSTGSGLFWDNTNLGLAIGGTTLDTSYALQINSVKGIRISGSGTGFGYSLARGTEFSSFANNGSAGVFVSTTTLSFLTGVSERMRINSNGNVLIGTTTDAGFRLDVSGSGRFTNGLTVTGSLIAPSITGSLQGTASWATNAVTASAAGTNTMVQYNNNGVLGGTSKFTFDGGTALLFVDGGITTKNTVTVSGSLIVSGSSIITGSLVVSGSSNGMDTTSGILTRNDVTKIDWRDGILYASTGVTSIDWENTTLHDASSISSLAWNDRILYTPGGGSFAWDNEYHTTSTLYQYSAISLTTQNDFIDNLPFPFVGQIIEGTIDAAAAAGQLVNLDTDGTWYPVKNTSPPSTKMLGICVNQSKGLVLLEGDVGVSDDNTYGTYVVSASMGRPVYVGTANGELDTTQPGIGVIRIVGHIYYQSTTTANYWLMKFRPSNDWYEI
jgi:hypothetical protein